MLNYDEFKRELLKRVRENAGEDMKVEIAAIQKNNGIQKEAIVFSEKEDNLQPVIYLDSIYGQYCAGTELSVCVGFTVGVCRSVMDLNIDMAYKNWEDVRGKIEVTVINKAWNADAMSGIPHREFLDLVLYCRVIIDRNGNGVASTIVRNHMLREWGISEEELWEAAFSNLKTEEFEIQDVNEVLGFIFREGDLSGTLDKNEFEPVLYVLTNKYQNRGAVGMFRTDLLEKFAEQGGCDLYILPSSIHEVLLLKDDEMPVDELRKVVRSVNRGMVDEMDWLSDEVYYYRRGSGKVEIAA